MSKFSELVKQHREMLHETQAEYAKRFNFDSPTAVSLWESGQRKVPERVLEAALDYIPRFTICTHCSGRGMLEIKPVDLTKGTSTYYEVVA
jgi:transcriptional regulator with XRE-family HTH domain